MASWVLVTVLLAADPQSVADHRLVLLPGGTEISVEALADRLAERDVVFLGEEHDNPVGHRLQRELLAELHQRRPDIVLSLEMFERDVQGVVDDYLRGRLTEEEFLSASRPWKNYAQDYRPLLEFARAHELDVIASNIPRDAAKRVSEGKEPAAVHRPFLPRSRHVAEDDYRARFVEIMEGHTGTDDPGALQRYYEAQCLKDDAMAESLSDYLAARPHRRPLVVHVCGKFHTDYGHGTALRLLMRLPLLRTEIVTMEATDDVAGVDCREYRDRAHVLWVVAKESKSTPKADSAAPTAPVLSPAAEE